VSAVDVREAVGLLYQQAAVDGAPEREVAAARACLADLLFVELRDDAAAKVVGVEGHAPELDDHGPRHEERRNAQPAHGNTGCMVSLNDFADRAPRVLQDGEVIDLGRGKRVRYLDTPHTPHGWDAGVVFEESTGTLLCGDLFTQLGNGPALTEGDVVGPAVVAEDLFRYSALNPAMGTTIRALAKVSPRTLALMHGPSFSGDGAAALHALAAEYDRRIRSGTPND